MIRTPTKKRRRRAGVSLFLAAAQLAALSACVEQPHIPALGKDQGDGNARRGPATIVERGRIGTTPWHYIVYPADAGVCLEFWSPDTGAGGCGPAHHRAPGSVTVARTGGFENAALYQGGAPARAARVVVELSDGTRLSPDLHVVAGLPGQVFAFVTDPSVHVRGLRAFDAAGQSVPVDLSS